MTQREKLIEKVRARPPEARFSDVQALLREFGWSENRQRGSHVTFIKAGEYPIVIPLVGGRKVKRHYLNVICERLGLDGYAND